jgi:hypothetical protein
MNAIRMVSVAVLLLTCWTVGSTLTADEKQERLLDGRDENYKRTDTDIRQAAGAPFHPAKTYRPRGINRGAAWGQTDRAWLVMLYKQNLIDRKTAAEALKEIQKHGGNEYRLAEKGVDTDIASTVNIGRTRQEPMARLVIRDRLLECIDKLLRAMDVTLDVAEQHAETIFAGRSHMSHGQPTTY